LPLALFQRRTIRCPTVLGWLVLLTLAAVPCLFWWFRGESFLSLTKRQPAEILVVEGWIGNKALKAAAVEFKQEGAGYIVTTGGLSNERWSEKRYSYAEMARYELTRAGVPPDRIIAAPAVQVETQRTFEMAAAAWRTIQAKLPPSTAINVFTIGPHARRSRLVFSKVFGSGIEVGVISWSQSGRETEPWWHSSERADDFLKETVGYFFELLLNSGRRSNSPGGS